ncbi:MAG: hypothetical protein PHW01_05130 [Patescibacteria group bacterium]|nr:hypothetical protein [Patescibacteria group bacterium]
MNILPPPPRPPRLKRSDGGQASPPSAQGGQAGQGECNQAYRNDEAFRNPRLDKKSLDNVL